MKKYFCLWIIVAVWGACTSDSDEWIWGRAENYGNEQYKDHEENPFLSALENPVSTFSVDADAASYTNMRRFVNSGYLPPASSVRIEEYVNFFTYDYAEPEDGENVSVNAEVTSCPWNKEHHLIRVGLKGKYIPESDLPASNYVLLIDVSGSMKPKEKLDMLKEGFQMMVDGLREDDRVAIVTYSSKSDVVLASTSCREKGKIKRIIADLRSGEKTAGAAGISAAYEIAMANLIRGGNNRIILATDGDFNVGPSTTEELVAMIEEKRNSGVFLTVLGVGKDDLNDHMIEQLADKGNGNYEYIDNADQLKKVFVYEKSRLHAIAKDCKVQLTFNPDRVESYRLIGYENRVLNGEDFDNDREDAGEIGVNQTVTAIYEVKLQPDHEEGEFAELDVRYKKPSFEQSRLLKHKITSTPVGIHDASENTRFASAVAGFGLIMKGSKYKGGASKSMILELVKEAKSYDPHGYRDEFYRLIQKIGF